MSGPQHVSARQSAGGELDSTQRIETKYRRIVTPIPAPESTQAVEALSRLEPAGLGVTGHVAWDCAEGFQIHDDRGNRWIDFTSGIYVANIGHAHPRVIEALRHQVEKPLLHAYLFATPIRLRFVKKLIEVTPANLSKVFLLTTGAESIECAVKLSRLYGLSIDPTKTVIVASKGAFHGKTMGAQMLSSNPEPKRWIVNLDPDIRHMPFPDEDDGVDAFDRHLAGLGIEPRQVAAFVLESYQGIGGPRFYPTPYVQALRRWADAHGALVVFDEIQSGFGRTGKLFAYEHYGVDADLVCCGKGISSCLPLSAVLGRGEILDLPESGSLSSTHTANPLACAAALATLEVLEEDNLVAESARKGAIFREGLARIQKRHPKRIARVRGRGLVYAIFFVHPDTGEPDVATAERVTDRAVQKGLMLFATHGDLVKMGPPLMIPDDALREGIETLGDAVDECLG